MRTVLTVDDDPDVRQIAVEILRAAGYRVVEAASPAQALEALAHEPAVELLFTDIMMPEMSGFELSRRAKQLHPGLRVLYTSGYVRDAPAGAWCAGNERLLRKPWRARQLREEVRGALGV
jgi:CheY-like chemotaxis protein